MTNNLYRLKHLFLATCLALVSQTQLRSQTLNYNFTAVSGAYAACSAPTQIIAASTDEGTSAATNIGFTFQYGCNSYTQFIASSNGWMSFNTAITSADLTNDLTGATYPSDLPMIAPLWDDLSTGSGGQVGYQLTGSAPNRVLTIEWKQMLWQYSATTYALSFQVKLYETSNRIEFCYSRNGSATANISSASASIGLSGFTAGDYYSLNGVGAAPSALKTSETNTLATKPASGQVYRWDPVLCSGAPTPGSAVASPSASCGPFTTTLSLTGSSNGCGTTYQWKSASAMAGPYSNIGTASSSPSQTFAVTGTTYIYCLVSCGASTANSSTVTTSINTANAGTGSYSVSLPYSTSGQTTCGMVNDITATNVTNVCGSSSYYTGEDVVYIFKPTTSGQLTAVVTSTGSYTGLMLYNGCPVSTTGTCVANAQDSNGNKQLCTNITAGNTYYLVLGSYASPTCNPYSLSLTLASAPTSTCNMAYTAATTTYSFENFVGTTTPSTDDVLYNTFVNFGFPFCFDGGQYWGGYIASNAAFVLDAVPCYPNIQTSTYAAGGVPTGYSITGPAPVNGTSIPRNAILAPWTDINPASTATLATTAIRYTTLGTAPNRRFIVSWENVPMFSSACETVTTMDMTSQVKLFETSNRIEIHVKNKQVCATWNNGQAVLGLHNYNGTIYVPPVNATMHNATASAPYNNWVMVTTAYKFTTSCGATAGSCIVLPIELLSFTGNREGTVNVLRWESASESGMREYVLERSLDGKNFVDVAHIPARNKASTYSYNDISYEKGFVNYYRIREVMLSGNEQQSGSVGISPLESEKFTTTRLFPNPTHSAFDIGVGISFPGNIEIAVYNTYGEKVISRKEFLIGFNSYTINTEGLQPGIYIVEVMNDQQAVEKQKLIIE